MGRKQLLDNMYDGQLLVFGHRGASSYAPMNTLPAFELAYEQGAQGIELDVHRTTDGELVVIHDFTVDATTNSSGSVSDFTLGELKQLDAGAWFDECFAGTRIPTLTEVIESVGRKLFINIEIKSRSIETDGIEEAVAKCIALHNVQDRVIVSSFNPLTLARFQNAMPNVPIGYLNMPSDINLEVAYDASHPIHLMVDEAYMEAVRREGYRVNTWTVNDPQRAAELGNLGVDAIITDKPDVVLDAVG